DNDYEPEDWDGLRFQAYGAFTTDRFGYARNYGMSDDKWHRFIDRYNIWDRSHYYGPDGQPVKCYTVETTPAGSDPHPDGNSTPDCYIDDKGAALAGVVNKADGTDDECAKVGRGSRCDTFSQKCTLPYRDRTAKQVQWYYTQGSNPEFFDGTDW